MRKEAFLVGITCLAAWMDAAGAAPGRFPIRVNQAGYLPNAPKICVTRNPPKPTFRNVLFLDDSQRLRQLKEVIQVA